LPGLKLTYHLGRAIHNEVVNAIRYAGFSSFAIADRQRGRSARRRTSNSSSARSARRLSFSIRSMPCNDAQKQIVLSQRLPAHQINDLKKRLHRAFKVGPDRRYSGRRISETGKLRFSSGSRGPKVCRCLTTVALYIAGRIKSNIRELEGSLIRLWHTLHSRPACDDGPCAGKCSRRAAPTRKIVTIAHDPEISCADYYRLRWRT